MKKIISALLLTIMLGMTSVSALCESTVIESHSIERDTSALITHIEERDNAIVAAGDIKFNKIENSSGYLVEGKNQVTINCVWYTRQKLLYEFGEADPGVGAWRNGEIYGGKYVASVIKNADLGMGGVTSPEKFMARLGEPSEDAMIVLYLGGHTVLIDAIIDGNVYYTDNWPASDFHYGVTEKLEATVEPLSTYLSRPNKKVIQSAVVLTPIQ